MARPYLLTALIATASIYGAQPQLTQLSFRPLASRGSRPLDRIVMISGNPDLLHIYDPVSTNDVTVSLPKPPLSLAVSPDGLHAAVGHDGLITWIDLATASILKTFSVTGQVHNPILGDIYAWFFVQGNGYSGGLTGLNLNTGAVITLSLLYYYDTAGIYDLSQNFLYVSQEGSSPNDMMKVPVAGGQVGNARMWPYHGIPNCGPYYLSLDGTRVYTSCGAVVHSSSDQSLDMYYLRALPTSSFPIAGLAESAGLKKLAVIPSGYTFQGSPSLTVDENVELFNTDYLTPAGKVTLLPFNIPSGTFAAHGQAVFFSKDETRLYVVVQADSTSNLSNGFGVEVIDVTNPSPCGVQLSAVSASVGATGSLGKFAVNADPACFYNAVSNADWIQVTSGAFGSGNGTVGWIARASSSGPRTGTIGINGQNFTIQQDGVPATPPSFAGLSFKVVDVSYNSPLDRIVAVSAAPDELHIYDPVAQTEQRVELTLPPLCVSVSPEGRHAAVGHDGWISYVDLQTLSVVQMFPVATVAQNVLLADNGYIYVPGVFSLEIASGKVTGSTGLELYGGVVARLEPNGKYFYTNGSKYDITAGVAVPYPSNFQSSISGNFWLFQDGTQIISSNGKVYTSSDTPSQDEQYTGSYPNVSGITWAADSSALHSTAVIPSTTFAGSQVLDNSVLFFGEAYLGAAGSLPLPQFSVGGKSYTGHGLFAFWNSAATSLYVIERADSTSGLLSPDAVFTISPPAAGSSCSASPIAPFSTIPAGGGFGGDPIAAPTGCAWTATSDSAWLVITAGAFGAGPGNISWNASGNPGASNRTAYITINGQSYSVMQLGAGATAMTVTPGALNFSATWGSATAIAAETFTVNSGAGSLTITSNPAWIMVTTVSPTTYSVSVNESGLPAGNNTGAVTVMSPDGQVQSVVVTLVISPSLTVTPASLTFQYQLGGPVPNATLSIADGTTSGTSFTTSAFGLTVSPSSGTLPASIQVTPTENVAGTLSASVIVFSGNKSVNVPVKITLTGAPISVTAVTSAGDFSAGPVAPGQIVVIWGSGLGPANVTSYTPTQNGVVPKIVAGTTVSFNGVAAPIIYTSSTAVCAIVPYALAGQSSASVLVSYQGSTSAPFAQVIAPTAPHFFTQTYTAASQISASNADYSPNSAANPSPVGSVVILYATGEGVTSPPGIDGTLVGSMLTQPLANVSVTISGQRADVLYAGGSPGSVEGLLQVDVRIPAGTPSGNAPVTMQIGTATTPSGGTIAVQ
ncbi:MAG TPA: BACON domain-containing carbohydrate-binding protein [Bryobacteraceae bacterium]|nr:BACON domain-containing carbohydrate-binding protein [Bryobacteraceae bacterium]